MKYKDFPNNPDRVFIYDADTVRDSVERLLTTYPGELLDNPEYGCNLKSYVYESLTDVTKFSMFSDIAYAINRWEKRVTLTKLDVDYDIDNQKYLIYYECFIPEFNATISGSVKLRTD